jgi:hypothetical protein
VLSRRGGQDNASDGKRSRGGDVLIALEKLWNGDVDVAAPFRVKALAACAWDLGLETSNFKPGTPLQNR